VNWGSSADDLRIYGFIVASFMEGLCMRVAVRNAGVVIVALVGAALLALTVTTTSVVAFAATTALIMGGTGHPLSTPPDEISFVQQYMGAAIDNFIYPSSTATPSTGVPNGPYNAVAVVTPEEYYPNGTLTFDQSVAAGKAILHACITSTSCAYNPDVGSTAPDPTDTFVAFGYSQSATIATLEKRSLAEQYAPGEGPSVSFVLIANGNRPNGGFLARGPQGFTIPLPFNRGGATFSGPTPTDTQYPTVDIAMQYDGWSDDPVNPFNLLAVMNANMGVEQLHPYYGDHSLTEPGIVNQGQYGDTTYYLVPTPILPLLMPLDQIPVIGHPLADALDAPLRVIVEAGYNRTISPGQPTPWDPLYFPNPISFVVNLAVSIPTGLDNGLEDIIGSRLFGTQRPGPYGVGGPSVTYLNPPDPTAATDQATAPTIASLVSSLGLDQTAAANQGISTLNSSVSVGGSTAAPAPLSSATVAADVSAADASAPTPESKPARRAKFRVPAVESETTINDLQRGIGSNSSQVKATLRPAKALMSRVHAGFKGGQRATSSKPSKSASNRHATKAARSAAK
jgi:PE-PPE domain